MDSNVIIALLIVVVLALVGFLFFQRQRSQQLQSRFGPEYDRAIKSTGDKSKAEAELLEREKRVKSLAIRPIAPADRERFVGSWQNVQAEFVDNPEASISHADSLLAEVMSTRGYPVSDFEQMSADVSVDHPGVIQNYRAGHDIAVRQKRGEASTEDLRQAMIHYRSLFEELVTDDRPKEPQNESGRKTDDGTARPKKQ